MDDVILHEAASTRYLSYALSVITSRALPDVRDGLKPVQRRILYAMFHNLHLRHDARHRKSAAIVGDVMAKYHPHGDQSIYDAMVRLAQPFSQLHTLVDGQGNFGSLDGDSPAAMRYTEAKLRPIASEILTELDQNTVASTANYDGQFTEPVVLPARFPHLLVNGSEGIAVGMATKIPPHNLREVIDACLMLIDNPGTTTEDLCTKIQGPDLPTGGEVQCTKADLIAAYSTGQGSVTVRSTYTLEKVGRKWFMILNSVPYTSCKADIVKKIGELVSERALPQIIDVRDESAEDVRIVVEIRKSEDERAAIEYLYKHTPLQQKYHINLTALVPTEDARVCVPKRLSLRDVLKHWLLFRYGVIQRRFEYDLQDVKKSIRTLEAHAALLKDLDGAIQTVAQAESKKDASAKIAEKFNLEPDQADYVVEMRLYKVTKTEASAVLADLAHKKKKAQEMEALLSSDAALWEVVRKELEDVKAAHAQPRRSAIVNVASSTYKESDYVFDEEAWVIVSRGGWIKRQTSVTDVAKVRVREGDVVGWMASTTTKSTISILTDMGGIYTSRVGDITATSGHGDPIQKIFKFADGEKIVLVVQHPLSGGDPHVMAVTRAGKGVRVPLADFSEPSSKVGRRWIKLEDDDRVCGAVALDGEASVVVLTERGFALSFHSSEVHTNKAIGKGQNLIKVADGDAVCAFDLASRGLTVLTPAGTEVSVDTKSVTGKRGSAGTKTKVVGDWVRTPSSRGQNELRS